ncbi:hypothetical protein [Nocardioides sp. SR21]|uniref:hypothetical protein n=1 Tax=Nocardioides sp. SR21 TaxID=2919501 RepID=UPI001FA9F158|nr:hypothetical protein [Nocardioides sp. SR21]
MSEHEIPDEKRHIIYIVAGVVLIALIVVGLVAYRGHESNEKAEANADQLIAVIEAAGYPAPDRDAIVGVLGDDGGAACEDPEDALKRATINSMLANGAAGPGARPVITDSLAVRGQAAIIAIYCPDELEAFEEHFSDYDFDDDLLDD